MTSEGEIIELSNQVKLLKVPIDVTNNMNAHVAALLSSIGLAYKQLKPVLQHASAQQRQIIMQSKIESKTLYGAPLIFNESESIQKRFESILMSINIWIYCANTYR